MRPSRMTTAERTVGELIAHGIDTIYALPGGHNDGAFDAFLRPANRISTVHKPHEQASRLRLSRPRRGRPSRTVHAAASLVCPDPDCSIRRPRCSLPTGMNAP